MTEVGLAGAVENRNQAGIDRVGLARIHHAAALGIRGDRKRAQQESILKMGEVAVQGVLGNGDAL